MKALHDAALARARAVWNTAQVHEVGEVPSSPTTPYLVVSVDSGTTGNYDLGGGHGSRDHRVIVQAFGANATEVTFAVEHADVAFLDVALDVPGLDCTRCRPEVSSPVIRDPDGGVLLSCALTYTTTAFITT